MKKKMDVFVRAIMLISLTSMALIVFGCSDSTSSTSGRGQVVVKMVDAPADYGQVNIVVTKVEIHNASADAASGWVVINNGSTTYDLISLRNGNSATIGSSSMDIGHYNQIRLTLGTGCNMVLNGTVMNLELAGEIQAGLVLNQEFDISEGESSELMIDFDVAHSIMLMGTGHYKLMPVCRIAPTKNTGTISGKVTPVMAKCTVNAISGADTLTTVSDTVNGSFKLMAVPPKTYTVHIIPDSFLLQDTTVLNVNVTAQQNSDIGILALKTR